MSEKKKLVENYAHDWNNDVLPLNKFELKENKIVEAEGHSHDVGYGYEVPVWKLDQKNLNERIYPKELGEKVVQEGKKTFNLKDHPEDEGSVDRIVGVSENPHIREGILYVDAYIVDEEFEKKLNKILERGMGLGVSSSAYGDVDENNRVMTEGFQLERYFDIVLDPSFQVYITNESKKQSEQVEEIETEEKREVEEEETETSQENNTNIVKEEEDNKEESKKENNTMAESTEKEKDRKLTFVEKNLKLGIKHLFEKAEATEDLRDKLGVYYEILEYCDDSETDVDFIKEYREEAEQKISEINDKLYELADKGKEVDTIKESVEKEKGDLEEKYNKLQENYSTLEEKYDKAVQMLDDLKLREEKFKEMYNTAVAERNGMVKASEYNELNQYVEEKEEEIEGLKEKVSDLRNKLRKEEKKNKRKASVEETTTRRKRPVKKVEEEEKPEKEEPVQEEEEEDESDELLENANTRVREYYEDMVERFPEVEQIKEQILTSKTIMEAQRTYLSMRDLIESDPSPYKKKKAITLEEEEEEAKEKYKTQKERDLNLRPGWL